MLSQSRASGGLALELAFFGGAVHVLEARRRDIGAILRFQRVRPARSGDFQPLRAQEITPGRLDRLLLKLRRWQFDILPIDDALRRVGAPATGRRFVCLSFDGAYRDVIAHAAPVLARHQAPFTVYVPTAFADGVASVWWLALERVVAANDRISLIVAQRERHFDAATVPDKHALFSFLAEWLQGLAPVALSHAIRDLCSRYAVDLAALSRAAVMDWDDLRTLAADSRVTIGTATVNYAALSRLDDAQVLSEMRIGREVAEAALHRDLPHFAYPFGDASTVGARVIELAGQAGFATAVTARHGVLWPDGRSDRFALPRISWDGRRPSLRGVRAMLAGIGG